jgi:hypothetical protein
MDAEKFDPDQIMGLPGRPAGFLAKNIRHWRVK